MPDAYLHIKIQELYLSTLVSESEKRFCEFYVKTAQVGTPGQSASTALTSSHFYCPLTDKESGVSSKSVRVHSIKVI